VAAETRRNFLRRRRKLLPTEVVGLAHPDANRGEPMTKKDINQVKQTKKAVNTEKQRVLKARCAPIDLDTLVAVSGVLTKRSE
jgi:hypothetical protein